MTTSRDGRVDDQTLGRWFLRRLRAVWPMIALTAAIVAAAALTAARSDSGLPLDPGSRRPDGTAALVEVLAALDRPVRSVAPDEIGDADVVLLLRDQLDDAQRAPLEARVRAGARVVVTDPTSPLAPEPAGQLGLLDRTLAAGCGEPAIADARAVRPAGGALYEVAGNAIGCFGDGDTGAWLVVTPMGRGDVVALGGPQFLTNDGLGDADHAVLAAQLLTPAGSGPPVIVRPVVPAAGDGQAGLGALVPTGVRVMVLQLLLAFGVVVAWRARRLGRPLVDRSPVRLASSELTSAVGALFARNGARAATSRRIADDTRARIARRLGLPASADTDAVAAAVAARTGGDAGGTAALDPTPPRDDRALLAISTELSRLETQVHTVTAPGWRSTDVD